jgi:ATPase subunit of ABC transporter with duplicated ATPase domains
MRLSINNLSKVYRDNQALDNGWFSLNPSQPIGLVGANGVGKSTQKQQASAERLGETPERTYA